VQKQRISGIISAFSASPELEIQQRAVEFTSLFTQGEIFVGVLERMPVPELKATVIGVGKLSYYARLSVIFSCC
jgi:AP-1 complex subunit gamma-1